MSWPVILSGVVFVAMLALGFNLLLPLGSGFETVCVLIGVVSAMIFFGLVDDAYGTVETPVGKSLAAMEMPVRIP
jgi:hypothetical protein